jgi:hypothetical protein
MWLHVKPNRNLGRNSTDSSLSPLEPEVEAEQIAGIPWASQV